MLRVGLTGGLGSGKSTAAQMFAALGAHLLSSDEIGRALMQPGEEVYTAIVKHFGAKTIVREADGSLDRAALSRIAFTDGRVEELNAIVHPAVIARQEALAREIEERDQDAIVMVESALIFETRYAAVEKGGKEGWEGGKEGWRTRFDKLILVTAPEELKVERFIQRSAAGRILTQEERAALEAEAYRRIAQQIPDEQKASLCDYVLTNDASIRELEWQVDRLWLLLQTDAKNSR